MSKNSFLQSSFIVFIGSSIVNVANYGFNLVSGRLLTQVEYGEVVSLITLSTVITVPALTLTTILANSTAVEKSKNNFRAILALFKMSQRFSVLAGLLGVVLFSLLLTTVQHFFNIGKVPLLVFAVSLPLSLLSATGKGLLQGLQDFKGLSAANIVEAFSKLTLAVTLILLGFSATGVMLALALSYFLAYVTSLYRSKKSLPLDLPGAKTPSVWSMFANISPAWRSVFFTTLLLSLFANIDVLLVKHYFPSEIAGLYAGLAVIGRTITFGSFAVVTVMFPMAAKVITENGSPKKLLLGAVVLTLGTSLVLLLLFTVVPEFVVTALIGKSYLAVAPSLSVFGVALTCAALAKVFIYFFMAAKKNAFLYPLTALTLLQVGCIAFFHESITQVIYSLLGTSIALLIAVVVLYFTQTLPKASEERHQ